MDADVLAVRARRHVSETLPRLKAKIICGSASNQLANDAIGDEVSKRGILYARLRGQRRRRDGVSLEIEGYNRGAPCG